MKTFVKLSEPKFKIYKDKGIVVCTITTRSNLPWHYDCLYLYNIIPNLALEKTFVGIARLKGDDTFNEAKGKRIAESKCKSRIYRYYADAYKKCLDKCIKELKDARQRITYLRHLRDQEINHIKEVELIKDIDI